MALLFLESFDHYGTNNGLLTRKWTATETNAIQFIPGRPGSGPRALQLDAVAGVRVTLGNRARWIVGFGLQPHVQSNPDPFLELRNASNVIELLVGRNPDGTLYVQSGSQRWTGTRVLQANNWYFVEVDATINTTSGAVIVRVNEVVDIQVTGVNTSAGGTNGATQVVIRGPNGGADFDDLYVCDNTGSTNNGFLGNVKVLALMPNGAGSSTQWAPTGATANWDCTDEIPPDDDTTYVSSSTAGQRDLYNFNDLTGNESVKGVQLSVMARKDDAGTRQIAPVMKLGSSVVVGPTYSIDNTYIYYRYVRDNAPDGSPWTPAAVNNLEAGMDLVV